MNGCGQPRKRANRSRPWFAEPFSLRPPPPVRPSFAGMQTERAGFGMDTSMLLKRPLVPTFPGGPVDLIADTNLVIALEREANRKHHGPAHSFLDKHAGDRFFITFTVAGELACGDSSSTQKEWMNLCRPYTILPWNRDVSWHYGEVFRKLKKEGALIGTNDLWIAATALGYGMSIVTNNTRDFERVAGLQLFTFS